MARYRPKGVGLERSLGTRALAATAYGDVGSSIYYALGLVAIFALGMTPIVYLIAGAIFVMTAMTYAEATANFPEAGGASSFSRRAFNELASFFAGWAQILNYVITVSISAYFVPHYLSVFWRPLGHHPYDILAGIAIVVALTTINIIGVRESARLNQLLAVMDFATQVLLVALGIFLVLNVNTLVANVHLGVAPAWSDFALAIPVAMVSYTGLETISNMAEEVERPRLAVPRSYRILVVAVLLIYIFLPSIALSAMPVTGSAGHYTSELATTFAGDPILGIVGHMGLGLFQRPMEFYVGILAATILLVAANAGIIGVSRLTYSLGQHQQLPVRLARISPRSRTPVVALVVFAVLAALVMVPGEATFLGNMYAFGAMLSFTTAHVALVGLRWRIARNNMKKLPGDVRVDDGEEEWYRAPLNVRVRGVELPLFAVIGGIGTAIAWVTVMALHFGTLTAGVGWLLVGLLVYTGYRRHAGLSLGKTTKISLPEPTGAHPVSYANVLLAFQENVYSPEALATATSFAAKGSNGIRVVVTIDVPRHLGVDVPLDRAERKAREIIETARLGARGHHLTGEVLRVRQGEAGYRIVEKAIESKAEAIVLPLSSLRRDRPVNKTVQDVLSKRPCRVLVVSQPSQPYKSPPKS